MTVVSLDLGKDGNPVVIPIALEKNAKTGFVGRGIATQCIKDGKYWAVRVLDNHSVVQVPREISRNASWSPGDRLYVGLDQKPTNIRPMQSDIRVWRAGTALSPTTMLVRLGFSHMNA